MVLARFRRRGAPLALLVTIALLSPALPLRSVRADEGDGDKVEEASADSTVSSSEDASALSGESSLAPAATPPTGSPLKSTTSQLSLPQGAGKLRGMGESFSADLSTAITKYQVPFMLPAARGAVQPVLGLSYSSSGGQGAVGLGWGIGVPTIARQLDRGTPKYNDPAPGTGWHPEQDRFVFGSDELVPICLVQGTSCAGVSEVMPAWSGGWQYFRCRVEGSFRRFFWSPDHRTWRIQDKNGSSMELGVPLDGSNETGALEVDPSTPTRIFSWHLSRQYDAQGDVNPAGTAAPQPVNTIIYKYRVVEGTSLLSDIFDTSPVATPTSMDGARYAHHVHLRYEQRPDVSTSYRRGWAIRLSQRLSTVDVTSFDFSGTSSAREMVRRYHLGYDPNSHVSLLTSVQMEGRCARPVLEQGQGELPISTGCPTLPAMTFGYQHVTPYQIDGTPGVADLSGYEGFDERVRSVASSPPRSINETLADLFDVNSDGLPDLLVTDPATNGGKHTVYFNGASGGRDSFGAGQPMGVEGVLAEDAYTLRLSNRNVSSHDVDGDAAANLLHMPLATTYSVYSPLLGPGGWVWRGRTIPTRSQQSPKIDFTGKSDDIRLMDANADGLIDVIYSAQTEYQTFFALGRYPGGDGQYGRAAWTTSATADISNDPVTSCTPSSTTAVRFSNADVRVADMDGDGFPDIVRMRPGSILYWPGRGNGTWGTGNAPCPAGSLGEGRDVAMANSPQFGVTSGSYLFMEDVNGDALADLIKVNFNQVDIYLNVDGTSWTPRHVISNAPTNSTTSNRVRLVDVNGSGTLDILWGEGNAYKYIDLAGGARPWVLTRASNGFGRTTDFEYATSAQQMLAAEAAGNPWGAKAPMPMHLLSRVIDSDHLDAVGQRAGTYVTEYTYRDPLYEGRQREFRGFRNVRAKTIGDANSPTSIVESTLLLGECQEEGGAAGTCDVTQRWRDNPREALKGLPVLEETFDEAGQYLSTRHSTYRLRRLFVGLDGREVRHAFQASSDTYRYDNGPFTPASNPIDLVDVELERSRDHVEAEPARRYSLRSVQGRAHLRTAVSVDSFGNVVDAVDYGCVEGCSDADEIITIHSLPAIHPDDASGWTWRTVEDWVNGSRDPSSRRKHTFRTYDARGLVRTVEGELSGTLPLDRFHEAAGKPTATTLPTAAQDGRVTLVERDYDAFGNETEEKGNPGHCKNRDFDPAYGQLLIRESVGTGYAETGCGTYDLSTQAEYDRGLAEVTRLTGPDGSVSTVDYDGFGRVTAMYKPDPDVIGSPSSVPSLKVQYLLPADALATPYSRVHSFLQDGASATTESFTEAWAYVDGLGRTIATVTQADPSAGDDDPWVVHGLTEHDSKGAPSRTYLGAFYSGDPSVFPTGISALSTRQRYDAFGRAAQSYGLDGEIKLRTAYHAMSTDAWDAADIYAGPHAGTPFTTQVDGHGFQVGTIERIHAGNGVEARQTRVTYLPTGEPITVARSRAGSNPVIRWMRYDSLGRMVLNVEPDASKNFNADPTTDPSSLKAWRYVYDPAGQVVGISDPRGCGINYYYLADGRALGEDYSPCLAAHDDYSIPETSNGNGFEVYNLHDAADPEAASIPNFPLPSAAVYKGRIASTSDRGAKNVLRYDGRGRVTAGARRIAKPGPVEAALGERYAQHWFTRSSTYDGADRPTVRSTGADMPELFGANVSSLVATEYTKRGRVKTVGGSYGTLVSGLKHDADGSTREITYGDVAHTTTSLQYDGRRRLASVFTHREAPRLWTSQPPAYSPAPNPASGPSVFQSILEDVAFDYDHVDNPTAIYDYRDPSVWPESSKPVSREFAYDDLYRLIHVDYRYASGDDSWTSPFAAENGGASGPRPTPHVAFPKRLKTQSFAYDWLGNTKSTDDDVHGFFDRSLGQITNGTANAGPYQLKSAVQATNGEYDGSLTARYDDAGALVSLAVQRRGPCLPTESPCAQRFAYEWDEAGRLARARRWDLSQPGTADDPLPLGPATAELRYQYDGNNERTLKTAVDQVGNTLHTAYIFDSLELRRAQWIEGDYQRTSETEAVYLSANDTRLARLYLAGDDVPTLSSGNLHVLLELADHLGSTSLVLDHATSELVEAIRYQAYGATESDYRPERWKGVRENYRFTGKEEDIEVGLTYFGARYLSPNLNRWISPDPLGVHQPGKVDLNVYAYVHGRALFTVDPFGLMTPQEYKAEIASIAKTADAPADSVKITGYNLEGQWNFADAQRGTSTVTPDGTVTVAESVFVYRPGIETTGQAMAAIAKGAKDSIIDTAMGLISLSKISPLPNALRDNVVLPGLDMLKAPAAERKGDGSFYNAGHVLGEVAQVAVPLVGEEALLGRTGASVGSKAAEGVSVEGGSVGAMKYNPGSTAPFNRVEGTGVFASTIDSEGVVELAVQRGNVSGREVFGDMMSHYGDNVRAIRGNFILDNMKTVNELTSQGMPVERAVNYTWTARMAWEHGFTNVTLEKVAGVPGNYTKVQVLFH